MQKQKDKKCLWSVGAVRESPSSPLIQFSSHIQHCSYLFTNHIEKKSIFCLIPKKSVKRRGDEKLRCLSFRDCFHLITQDPLSPPSQVVHFSQSTAHQLFLFIIWELFIGVLLYLSWSGVGHLRAGRNRVEGPSGPQPHLPVIYCVHTIIPCIMSDYYSTNVPNEISDGINRKGKEL